MRRITASTFISLDGVMQAPGGPDEDTSGGFTFGGWTFPHFDAETGGAMAEIFARPFDLLLGRKTYEIFAGYWPFVSDPDGPIAGPFNRATKYVASRSLKTLSWQNSRLLGDDVPSALQRLKSEDGPDLLVQGSSVLMKTLWETCLLDEFHILTFPVLLGKGKHLFDERTRPAGLKLIQSKTYSTGVIVAKYWYDGAVKTGSFV